MTGRTVRSSSVVLPVVQEHDLPANRFGRLDRLSGRPRLPRRPLASSLWHWSPVVGFKLLSLMRIVPPVLKG
jgi:hypothetical protein